MKNFHTSALDNHVAFKQYFRVQQTCHDLFDNSPVTYFCFQRIYSNGFYTLLFSDPKVANYLLKNPGNCSEAMWQFANTFENLNNGFMLWDIAKSYNSHEQNRVTEHFVHEFNLPHGIDIIEKGINHVDFYTFASNSLQIYQYSISKFYQFIFYFRQESQKILEKAYQERFLIPRSQMKCQIPIFKMEGEHHDKSTYKLDKYYLSNIHEGIYITSQELVCLQQLANGLTSKQAAYILKISHRTIESYMSRLKQKLNCSYLTEVIKIARENHLLE